MTASPTGASTGKASPAAPLLLRDAVPPAMADFLESIEGDFTRLADAHEGFLQRLSRYVLINSGKRVRPALVHACAGFGPADAKAVREVSLAVELIHIATLVHDDLVDEAVMRRQKPTVGVHFGEGAAVLLGDHVYAQSFQRLAALGDPDLLKLFSDTTMVMCEGEIGQLEHRYRFDLTEEAYISFLDKKTASLMAAACRAGGRLAGLSEAQNNALDAFGRNAGVAFQIMDDLLDMQGEEAVTGKTLRTDLTHGKMTLPLIYHARSLADGERARLFEELKNPNGHLSDLIRRVESSGVLDQCRRKISQLLSQAEEALSALPDHPSRRLLSVLARLLADRRL